MHLSEKTPALVENARGAANGVIWKPLKLGVAARVGATIPAGARLLIPGITIRPGEVGLITLGPRDPEARNELPFEVEWRPDDAEDGAHTLLRASLRESNPDEPWTDYRFAVGSVDGGAGSIVIRNGGGWRFWRRSSDLVLYDLAISDEASLDLERARSFREVRIRNELVNMDEHYSHAMFQADQDSPAPEHAAAPPQQPSPDVPPASAEPSPATASTPVISANQYAHEQLYMKVRLTPPLFGSLLKARTDALRAGRATGNATKVRVLSLCSGGARTELGLVKDLSPDLVSMTLFDVNPNLLKVAQRNFSSWGPVQTIVGDVNGIDLQGEQFDVVLCVAALHHVVELEHVIHTVAEAIGDTGEFWSMAEAVGRNGGRMWPEAYAVANEYFSRLPEKYRFNRNTNAVDRVLQNIDYSIGCFEGIRCEAIEPTLLKYLEPVHVSRHNCIVWKLFSLAYNDNYDVAKESDRKLIDTAVDLDVDLQRHGRYGVELHGVYRRKHP